jgi:hypothetical protein
MEIADEINEKQAQVQFPIVEMEVDGYRSKGLKSLQKRRKVITA